MGGGATQVMAKWGEGEAKQKDYNRWCHPGDRNIDKSASFVAAGKRHPGCHKHSHITQKKPSWSKLGSKPVFSSPPFKTCTKSTYENMLLSMIKYNYHKSSSLQTMTEELKIDDHCTQFPIMHVSWGSI